MKRVLIDTDVILDFFFDRKPFSDSAAKVLSLCESKEITGFITSVILSNVYYLLKQTSTHEKVVEKLSQLVMITEILTTDRSAIIQALNSDFRDFEDAIQYFTAIENDQKLVISRNKSDFKGSKIPIMTASEFLKSNIV